jgi:hypothetical protein
MKTFWILLSGVIGLSGLNGCSVNDSQPAPEATVQTHFFPLDNGLVYTYSRFNHNTFDTLTCRLIIGQTLLDKNVLVDTKTDSTLYALGFTHDVNGNLAAVMQNGDTSMIVLDGQLLIGATWIADAVHNIRATIIDHYDDYYLPGRLVHFPDVLAVKYHQDGQPSTDYTLRYFARDQGLIFERELVEETTEIASLQLLNVNYPSSMAGRAVGHLYPESMMRAGYEMRY